MLRQSYQPLTSGLLAVAAAMVPGPAAGGEQLLLPFQCTVSAGQVLARPAEDQSYRVLGPHVTDVYTMCSPQHPDLCRTMQLHRFDVDCGGTPVSWAALYAAIAKVTARNAWMENGRLLVDIRPQPGRRRVHRGFPEHPFPEQGSEPFVVEMPPGFAPTRGTVARFAGTPDAPSPPPVADASPHDIERSPSIARLPVPERTFKEPEVKTAKEDRKTVAKATPDKVSSDAVKESKPAVHAQPLQPKSAEKPTSEKIATAVAGKTVRPTIINAPQRAKSAEKKGEPGEDTAKPAQPETAPTKAAAPTNDVPDRPVAASKSGSQESNPAQSDPSGLTDGSDQLAASLDETANSVLTPATPTLGNTMLVLLVVATLLLSLAAIGYRLSKRKAQAARPLEASRDLSSVVLSPLQPSKGAPGLTRQNARDAATLQLNPNPVASKLPSGANGSQLAAQTKETYQQRDSGSLVLPHQSQNEMDAVLIIPTNRQEALAALGVGEQAGLDVIERIVDGLRQSWHSDGTATVHDRRIRERRLLQIDTAWKILSGSAKSSA